MTLPSPLSGSSSVLLTVFPNGDASQPIATTSDVASTPPAEQPTNATPFTVGSVPYFMTLCFLAVWAIALLVFLESAVRYGREAVGKKYSQIPCCNCQFYSNNPHLRCAVHPAVALTKQAIECKDYTFSADPKSTEKKRYHPF